MKFKVILDCEHNFFMFFISNYYALHYRCLICSILNKGNNRKLMGK
jgi:hypothetical protein